MLLRQAPESGEKRITEHGSHDHQLGNLIRPGAGGKRAQIGVSSRGGRSHVGAKVVIGCVESDSVQPIERSTRRIDPGIVVAETPSPLPCHVRDALTCCVTRRRLGYPRSAHSALGHTEGLSQRHVRGIKYRDDLLGRSDREAARFEKSPDEAHPLHVDLAVIDLVRRRADALGHQAFALVVLERRQGYAGSFRDFGYLHYPIVALSIKSATEATVAVESEEALNYKQAYDFLLLSPATGLSGPMVKGNADMVDSRKYSSSNGQIREAFENQLVMDYLDLAESLARRFAGRGREREDLVQVAYLGLVKAARAFDESRGTSFPGFAAPTITGELKRYLRDRCWVVRPPRGIQNLRAQLLRAEHEMAQELGRHPSPTELARELDVSVQAVREAAAAGSSMRPDSLDAADPHCDAPSPAEKLAVQDPAFEQLDELMCLTKAIGELSGPERELLYRRYFCEETQTELGKRFGVSQMQISRRLARVLVWLQQRLAEAEGHRSPRSRTASRTS